MRTSFSHSVKIGKSKIFDDGFVYFNHFRVVNFNVFQFNIWPTKEEKTLITFFTLHTNVLLTRNWTRKKIEITAELVNWENVNRNVWQCSFLAREYENVNNGKVVERKMRMRKENGNSGNLNFLSITRRKPLRWASFYWSRQVIDFSISWIFQWSIVFQWFSW